MSENIWESLGEEPRMFKDCCCSLSKPLIKTLSQYLPRHPSQVLSVSSSPPKSVEFGSELTVVSNMYNTDTFDI
jgi:hypothetical protein